MFTRVTVVTVCYNSEETIAKTISSVLEQDFDQIEYIIVDGSSSDSTLDIIGRYMNEKKIVLISEPDDGLYDAMNKAVVRANGDYIIFMNSGDVFASKHAISDISPYLDGQNEMVYGNVIRIKPSGRIVEKYGNRYTPMFLLLQGRMMCHQSIFTRCDIMKQYMFNTDFSITADYDFLMRMVRDDRKLQYADVTVSVVDNVEGISSSIKNMDKMREQDDLSLKANFPAWYYALKVPKSIIRFFERIKEKNEYNNDCHTDI